MGSGKVEDPFLKDTDQLENVTNYLALRVDTQVSTRCLVSMFQGVRIADEDSSIPEGQRSFTVSIYRPRAGVQPETEKKLVSGLLYFLLCTNLEDDSFCSKNLL